MPAKDPKSIKSLLLGELPSLSALGKRAQDHHTLLEQIRVALPEPFRDHVIAADISDTVLTVVCDSAPWATKVRFYSHTLLQNPAPDHKSAISTVAVKVRPRLCP